MQPSGQPFGCFLTEQLVLPAAVESVVAVALAVEPKAGHALAKAVAAAAASIAVAVGAAAPPFCALQQHLFQELLCLA